LGLCERKYQKNNNVKQVQLNSSPEQLGIIAKIFKDFGVLQTLSIILSGVGIYGLYKFIITKLDLLKSGKDRELEDLKKAVWYLNRRIEQIQK
jgi:hypothetical protein